MRETANPGESGGHHIIHPLLSISQCRVAAMRHHGVFSRVSAFDQVNGVGRVVSSRNSPTTCVNVGKNTATHCYLHFLLTRLGATMR